MASTTAPPPPRYLVQRPRLVERLDRGVDGVATLVCGPAGSGKTVLLSRWLAERMSSDPVAWVPLERFDDHPTRFWSTVLEGLRGAADPPPGHPLESLAPPLYDSLRRFPVLLVDALAGLNDPVVLVLDDLQVIRHPEVLDQLSFVLLHAPSQLRTILSARADPALPLHVLRVAGQLTEIRADELSFSESEAADLFVAHELTLDSGLVAALHARTEGWAAGLRLAALSLQAGADAEEFVADFAGNDRVVADYLVAEVLDRQPPERRRFLLRTSVADRLCAGLVDALTGEDNGQATLSDLERSNAFLVALDRHGGWYRYHQLFAGLLRARAAEELNGEVADLHRRAARWFAEQRATLPALRHALIARDWELATDLIAEDWFTLSLRGDVEPLYGLLDRLPPERVEADAELAAALACARFEAGDVASAMRHLERATAGATDLPEHRRPRCDRTIEMARLYLARHHGDEAGAVAAGEQLLQQTAGGDPRTDMAQHAFVLANVGIAEMWSRQVVRAEKRLERAVATARAAELDFLTLWALGHLALMVVARSGPEAGEHLAREAVELARRRGWSGTRQAAPAHVALAAAAMYRMRLDEAEAHLERASDAARMSSERQLKVSLAFIRAGVLAARGRLEAALQGAEDVERTRLRGPSTPFERPLVAALRVRLLVAMGQHKAAHRVLSEARGALETAEVWAAAAALELAVGDAPAAAERLERRRHAGPSALLGSTVIELPLLEALAHAALGDAAARRAALERALAAAERSGHRSPFLSGGQAVHDLLRSQIRDGTAHRALVGDLLDVVEDRGPGGRDTPLRESLSAREETILRYLPTAMSNVEIAGELFVSPNTVKTHLRSIYRKLDVQRRRDAVERARALRLLGTGLRR